MKNINIIVGLFCVSSLAAQSTLDWLLNPVGTAKSVVSSQVEDIAHEAWEGFLDDDIKTTLSKDALKIANYSIDSSYLATIDKTYKQYTYGVGMYTKAMEDLSSLPLKYIYIPQEGKFANYGEGVLGAEIMTFADKISSKYLSISRLDLFLSYHPDLQYLNEQWQPLSRLKNNIYQLYYWGILSQRQTFISPKKYNLPSPKSLIFTQGDSTFKYNVLNPIDKTVFGSISPSISLSKCTIIVKDIALLNYAGMPNATYQVGNVTYMTDCIGRIIRVEQIIRNADKHKSMLNNKHLKTKTFVCGKEQIPYAFVDLKYNGTISYLNIIPLRNTKENKKSIKLLRKHIAQILKENDSMRLISTISYDSNSMSPSNIVVSSHGTDIKLSNK